MLQENEPEEKQIIIKYLISLNKIFKIEIK